MNNKMWGSYEKAIREVLAKRNQILEDFIKTHLAANLPEGLSASEAAKFYINNCSLCITEPKLVNTKDGEFMVQKYWIEWKERSND